VHYAIRDYVKAIEFQEKCVAIMKKIFDKEDPKVLEAENLLQNILKSISDKIPPTSKKIGDNKKSIGVNKNVSGDASKMKLIDPNMRDQEFINIQDIEEFKKAKEREALLQKLRVAKMNAKYGVKKRPEPDMMNYVNPRSYMNTPSDRNPAGGSETIGEKKA